MKQTIKQHWHAGYLLVLVSFSLYLLLEAFLLPQSFAVVEDAPLPERTEDAVITDNSYSGNGITITITHHRAYGSDLYLADIILDDPAHLRTAFAQNTYGKNILAPVSVIAQEHDAILAINGDYYSARDGYVIRNGVLYRDTGNGSRQEALAIGADGSFSIVRESVCDAQTLLRDGAAQVLSFGPGLIEGGEITFDEANGEGKELTRNPRTAIGYYGGGHYLFLVADGRTDTSEGLTIAQLAEFLHTLGVQTAYNLDGGGSSTMVFNGAVVNQPTDGHNLEERNVSDIVYIG